ncbi:hypothetical protein BGZ52_012941, partial [Haplosporangium bisporale]
MTETIQACLANMDVNLESLRAQAAENSEKAQARQSRYYNKMLVPVLYHANDLVLLRITQPTAITQSAKFSQVYEGPYTIVRPLMNGTYLIGDSSGQQDIVHVERLKPYSSHTHMVPEILVA